MAYLSRLYDHLRDYVRHYPKTLAIRAVAMMFFAGYFWVFPAALPIAAVIVVMAMLGYMIIEIRQFFGLEIGAFNRLTFLLYGPYYVFQLIWNLLSSPSEVDEL